MEKLLRKYADGETLYQEGEAGGRLFLVHRGRVRLLGQPDRASRRVLLLEDLLGIGDVCGALSAPFRETAVASGEVEVEEFAADALGDVVAGPVLAEALEARVAALHERLRALRTLSVPPAATWISL